MPSLLFVSGEAAAAVGYVNPGPDRRVGGALGRILAQTQREWSFKSTQPPERHVEQRQGVLVEITLVKVRDATHEVPAWRPHLAVAIPYGTRWATFRLGWRYDPNWGNATTIGYNPEPEVVGGYILDGVIKLNASQPFIQT